MGVFAFRCARSESGGRRRLELVLAVTCERFRRCSLKLFGLRFARISFGVKIVNAVTCIVNVDWEVFCARAGNFRKPREINGSYVEWAAEREGGLSRRFSGALGREFWLIQHFRMA